MEKGTEFDPTLAEMKDQATYLGVSPEEEAESAVTLSNPRFRASIGEMEDGLLVDITPSD